MATGSRRRGDASRAVAAEIKAERARQKVSDPSLTQSRVSEESGIPLNTLKSIETGRGAIDVDQLFAIADALNVLPSVLVHRAEGQLGGDGTVVPIRRGPNGSGPGLTVEDLIDEPSAAEPPARAEEPEEEPEGP